MSPRGWCNTADHRGPSIWCHHIAPEWWRSRQGLGFPRSPQRWLRRAPEELERLLAGRRRVALVQVDNLAQPPSAEPWLREDARLVGHLVLYFDSTDGDRFAFTRR